MAIDSTREARRAGLTILKASALVTALVPPASIYSQSQPRLPTFPFIKWGAFNGAPLVAACLDGQELTGAVHAFAHGRKEYEIETETAEDVASRIGAAIARALDRQTAAITGGRLSFFWRGSQLFADDDGAFHSVQSFRIRCTTV